MSLPLLDVRDLMWQNSLFIHSFGAMRYDVMRSNWSGTSSVSPHLQAPHRALFMANLVSVVTDEFLSEHVRACVACVRALCGDFLNKWPAISSTLFV